MSAMLWRLHDTMFVTKGGGVICGDDDGFAPDAEAFEET